MDGASDDDKPKVSRRRTKTRDRKTLGLNIRNARYEKEMTQYELAEGAGLHPTYISSIERGERNVSMETIISIARVLKCSPKDLMPD